MAGISLHIGLNRISAAAYYPLVASDLVACEFDAQDMQLIAKRMGYQTNILLTEQATHQAVVGAIASAAKQLRNGDTFLLTYSGHGSQVKDTNGDEEDKLDETWVLYNRMITDDELYQHWQLFASGVRILVLSDSCHSGTVTRYAPSSGLKGSLEESHPRIERSLPLQDKAPETCAATGLLISGCQDNQVSYDGRRNGAFTAALLSIWANGRFRGNYQSFYEAIAKKLPKYQKPNYFLFGSVTGRNRFIRQNPFTT